jgi:flavin-dependent dehydrogenase
MAEAFDAIVLGMGPGGEAAAGRLLKGGQKIAVVERERRRTAAPAARMSAYALTPGVAPHVSGFPAPEA